jgi:hypothetical protein
MAGESKGIAHRLAADPGLTLGQIPRIQGQPSGTSI